MGTGFQLALALSGQNSIYWTWVLFPYKIKTVDMGLFAFHVSSSVAATVVELKGIEPSSLTCRASDLPVELQPQENGKMNE